MSQCPGHEKRPQPLPPYQSPLGRVGPRGWGGSERRTGVRTPVVQGSGPANVSVSGTEFLYSSSALDSETLPQSPTRSGRWNDPSLDRRGAWSTLYSSTEVEGFGVKGETFLSHPHGRSGSLLSHLWKSYIIHELYTSREANNQPQTS